jgi:flagellar assembly factor FliW
LHRCLTRSFGEIEFEGSATIHFPAGLPGFEQEREFVIARQPGSEPLLFLQSVASAEVCLPILPMRLLAKDFEVPEDCDGLGPVHLPGVKREDLLVFAVVATDGAAPTANLLAPLVVNVNSRIGAQLIVPDSGYSHREPVIALMERVC